MDKTGLTEPVIRTIIKTILERGAVNRIILYGSRARGDHRPASDIDLALDAPRWSPTDLAVVKDRLEEAVPVLLKFDLVLMSAINKKSLMDNILKEGMVLYESTAC